ncbi:hypothetical protein AAY473_016798 [Plecturocebus cupreus]
MDHCSQMSRLDQNSQQWNAFCTELLNAMKKEKGNEYKRASPKGHRGSPRLDIPTRYRSKEKTQNTLGSRGRQITGGQEFEISLANMHFGRLTRVDDPRSGFRDKSSQHGETLSLLKIQKLARRALWEAEVGGSQGQEFETSLANMRKGKKAHLKNICPQPGAVAHTCNPSTFGGQGPRGDKDKSAIGAWSQTENPSPRIQSSRLRQGWYCHFRVWNHIHYRAELLDTSSICHMC